MLTRFLVPAASGHLFFPEQVQALFLKLFVHCEFRRVFSFFSRQVQQGRFSKNIIFGGVLSLCRAGFWIVQVIWRRYFPVRAWWYQVLLRFLLIFFCERNTAQHSIVDQSRKARSGYRDVLGGRKNIIVQRDKLVLESRTWIADIEE